MSQTKPAENQSSAQSSSHRKERQPRPYEQLKHLWAKWRVEILIVLLVALAIFLLVERMQIRQTLLGWLRQGLQTLSSLVGGVSQAVVDFVRNTTISDLIGYALLLVVLVLVTWRARFRILSSPRLTQRECPLCGGGLHRIHRRWRDRVLNRFVPVYRYRCKDPDCSWSGLRVGKAQHE